MNKEEAEKFDEMVEKCGLADAKVVSAEADIVAAMSDTKTARAKADGLQIALTSLENIIVRLVSESRGY